MPANNCSEHGFYQFSPELFYMLFTPENSFEVNDIFLAMDKPFATFYKVVRTEEIKRRTELINETPTLMFGSFKKVDDFSGINRYPIQYNYQISWNKSTGQKTNTVINPRGLIRNLMIRISTKWYFSFSINRSIKRIRKERSLSNTRFFIPAKEIA